MIVQNPSLAAHPASFAKTAYTILDGDEEVARLTLRLRDEGVITVGEAPFALGGSRHRYVLLFEGVEVARAVQPSAWRRRLEVRVRGAMLDRAVARPDAPDVDLVLQAKHPFSRTFELFEGERLAGEVRRASPFSRKAVVDLPAFLPLAVRVFLFALVVIQWRRADRQAAASGS